MQHSKWFPYLVLAAAGAAVLVVLGFPLAALLPFVFILACPLMMVVMMKGMAGVGGMHGSGEDHCASQEGGGATHPDDGGEVGEVVGAGSSAAEPSGLAARKVTMGGLIVTITPKRFDASGAEFTVAFDTHTGAPDIDVAARSALAVDGTPWTGPAWSGDGSGGHPHRHPPLAAAGPARGEAHLTMTGLERPLDVAWQL